MNRNFFVVVALSALVTVGCQHKTSGPSLPGFSPSGTTTLSHTILTLGRATPQTDGKYSILWTGRDGPISLKQFVRTVEEWTPDLSWSGVNARFIDLANSPENAAQTQIAFSVTPVIINGVSTTDHFDAPSLPGITFPKPAAKGVAFKIHLIPGGQKPPFREFEVILDSDLIEIQTPLKPEVAKSCTMANNTVSCAVWPY